MNLQKIFYAVGALALGLLLMATVSPELFTVAELTKTIEHLIQYKDVLFK